MRKFVSTFFDTKDSSSSKVVKLQGKHTLLLDKNNSRITKTAPPKLSLPLIAKTTFRSNGFKVTLQLCRIYFA